MTVKFFLAYFFPSSQSGAIPMAEIVPPAVAPIWEAEVVHAGLNLSFKKAIRSLHVEKTWNMQEKGNGLHILPDVIRNAACR